jgi:hypothetical protein
VVDHDDFALTAYGREHCDPVDKIGGDGAEDGVDKAPDDLRPSGQRE